MSSPEWHIITCEYPPQIGGVSDYTWLVAKGLAEAGDRVHVWCPPNTALSPSLPGVTVHPALGSMSRRDWRRVGRLLDEFPAKKRLLIQWVPHGYGCRSMNVPFCGWLWERARFSNDEIDLMVHEPFLAFGEGTLKQDAAAAVHRMMAMIILNAATRVWLSIPAWETRLRPYLLGRKLKMEWLPVPSNVEQPAESAVDSTLFPSAQPNLERLGHFGTFGRSISVMLESLVEPLLRGHRSRSLLLIGRGSTEFRLRILARQPDLKEQLFATGVITGAELSAVIRNCDLMIQPYPDGISGRRSSAMAALSHGVPLVTTAGALTEDLWRKTNAARLVPFGVVQPFVDAANELLANHFNRKVMGLSARRLYLDRFDIRHTIHTLRLDRAS
jgi:glycosyltransferase involved in cell wall biosynthesis